LALDISASPLLDRLQNTLRMTRARGSRQWETVEDAVVVLTIEA